MNKIRNALGLPGSLNNLGDIVTWEIQVKRTEKKTMCYSVPVINSSIELESKEILTEYFELLFFHFHLIDRLKKYSGELKTYAKSFYNYLFLDENRVNNTALLKLLVCDPREKANWIINDTKDAYCTISKVFNYEYLTSEYRKEFAKFIQMLGVDVCPYCGRNYTTTVQKKGGGFIRANQVDHYFPKSKYPWLALSIWNLIPVCSTCNNQKSDHDTPFLYPYTEEMEAKIRFCTHPSKGVGYLVGSRDTETDFVITLKRVNHTEEDTAYFERAENEINRIGINDLYSVHNNYVCDIFRQRYVFGHPYIDDLVLSFPELFRNREDVRAMLYMKRIEADRIGGSSLDKLTRDINIEIDQLIGDEYL